MSPLILSSITLGFFGSLHCVAMCGPLAAAGCSRNGTSDRSGLLAYLAGRCLGYGFVGALLGAVGLEVSRAVPLDLFQRVLLGVIALTALSKGVGILRGPARARSGDPPRGSATGGRPRTPGVLDGLLRVATQLMPRRGLALGLATGFLPCGFLFSAWALAASSGDPLSGAAVMGSFALATAPALVGAVLASRVAGRLATQPAIVGGAWCVLGVWIGLRPFLDVVRCCQGGG